MDVEFNDEDLDRLETDPRFDAGHQPNLVKAYRKVVNFIRQAQDQRDFASMRSLRFERLKGGRRHQYSMRLNDQFRLILELKSAGHKQTAVLMEIVDYH